MDFTKEEIDELLGKLKREAAEGGREAALILLVIEAEHQRAEEAEEEVRLLKKLLFKDFES